MGQKDENGKAENVSVSVFFFFLSIKLRFIVMSTDLEYRAREIQRKRESRATGQRSLTRKGARAREKKQKETFSVGGTK